MPDMPTLDITGLFGLMAIMLSSLAVTWGVSKAIQMVKSF